jgi:hypothetical protein
MSMGPLWWSRALSRGQTGEAGACYAFGCSIAVDRGPEWYKATMEDTSRSPFRCEGRRVHALHLI